MKPKTKLVMYFLHLIILAISLPSFAIPIQDDDGNSSAWIAQFNVSSSFAKVGKPVTLQWQSFFSVGCSLSTSQTGGGVVPTSGSTTVTPTQASVMTVILTCAGTDGSTVSQARSFSVNKADHPELNSLEVSTNSAPQGTEVTLTWSSSFSNSCELTGTNNEVLAPSGNQNFIVQPGNNIFRLVCRANDGRESRTLIKNVTGQSSSPTIVFFFNTEPNSGQYFLFWNAVAESCTLNGTPVGLNASRSFPVPFVFDRHTLTCFRNGQSTSRTIMVFANNGGGIVPILDDSADGDGNHY